MRITNTQEIYTALMNGEHIDFDKQGNLESHPTGGGVISWLLGGAGPPPSVDDKSVLFALTAMIEKENILKQGPQDLTQSLHIRESGSDYMVSRAQTVLAQAMIKAHVQACLAKEAEPIRIGVTAYLQSKWSHLTSENSFDMVKSFVDEQISEFREKNLLGVLACGYTLGPGNLKEATQYLQDDLISTVQETWCEARQQQFDKDGVYAIFKKDAERERPYVFGQCLSRQEFDNETAKTRYCALLKDGLKERSMIALTSILMSQTIMPKQAEMVSGVDTPFPLNPYSNQLYSLDVPEIMTGIVAEAPKEPRSFLTQTEKDIIIQQKLIIKLTNMNNGHEAPVGSLSYLLTVPKDQFPLPLGAEPKIYISEMTVDREKPYLYADTN